MPIIIKKVKMRIGEQEFDARVAWCLEEDVPPLLGRIDVFNRFKITFDEENKEIIFEWKGKK